MATTENCGDRREMTLEEKCKNGRDKIEHLKKSIYGFSKDVVFQSEQAYLDQHSEMKANIKLAYRHLEDARMRLGKVMQHIQGGVSIFDRK